MSHQIKLNGRYVSPERAAREKLPLDIELACSAPGCGSRNVVAGEARASTRIGEEYPDGIPRQQDRRCLACGYCWTVVLAPLAYNTQSLIISGRGR